MNNILTCPVAPSTDFKLCPCRLFAEVNELYREYVQQNLLTFRTKRQLIDFEYYLRHVQYSCLIEELLDKLLCFWDRPSVFSHA